MKKIIFTVLCFFAINTSPLLAIDETANTTTSTGTDLAEETVITPSQASYFENGTFLLGAVATIAGLCLIGNNNLKMGAPWTGVGAGSLLASSYATHQRTQKDFQKVVSHNDFLKNQYIIIRSDNQELSKKLDEETKRNNRFNQKLEELQKRIGNLKAV